MNIKTDKKTQKKENMEKIYMEVLSFAPLNHLRYETHTHKETQFKEKKRDVIVPFVRTHLPAHPEQKGRL